MVSIIFRFSSNLIKLHNYENVTLRKSDDPVLRHQARDVTDDELNSDEFKVLLKQMVDLMRANRGQGIAAPQVGVGLRVIAVEFSAQDYENAVSYYGEQEVARREMRVFPLTVLVNPTMRVVDFDSTVFEEGCLSLGTLFGPVKRFKGVEIEGLDERGEAQTIRASGWTARILQHEMHHLKGLLIPDYFVKKSRGWLRNRMK